jgi:hypothetical protein
VIVGANLDAGCARALKVSESVIFLVLEDLAEPAGQLGQVHSTLQQFEVQQINSSVRSPLDAVGLMNNAG